MIKLKPYLFILLYSMSCSVFSPIASDRNQKWSNFFNEDEQKRVLFLRALDELKTGKSRPSVDHLNSAEEKFQFLFDEYFDLGAKEKLVEIATFRDDYKTYYDGLIEDATKKNLIFTAAGYHKQIQRLFPADTAAASFFTKYESEIPQRLKRNLAAGDTYLAKNQLNSAKRCFNRVLLFDPKNSDAIRGLSKVNNMKKSKRVANSSKKSTKKKTTTEHDTVVEVIPKQTAAEIESLYLNGVKAYEQKDYLKAYELFEAIEDTTYKDTELYFNRSQDKIDALGLSDDN